MKCFVSDFVFGTGLVINKWSPTIFLPQYVHHRLGIQCRTTTRESSFNMTGGDEDIEGGSENF